MSVEKDRYFSKLRGINSGERKELCIYVSLLKRFNE